MDNNEEKQLAVLCNDIQYIKLELIKINKRLDEQFVQKNEFHPVMKIVYGIAGLVLVAFATAVVQLVVKGG